MGNLRDVERDDVAELHRMGYHTASPTQVRQYVQGQRDSEFGAFLTSLAMALGPLCVIVGGRQWIRWLRRPTEGST
jgi:hypothetical protein